MASITPTIGRKVYYNPRGQDHIAKYDDQPLDATIIYVWPKLDQSNPFDLVNLFIVDHAGGMSMRAHVPLVQDGQEAPLAGHYVEWVPYQKGQAKAAEIPNVVAGSASQEVPPSGPTESVTSASSVANPEASPLPNESAPMPDSGSPQVSSSEPQPPTTSEATPTSTNGDFGSALTALKAGKKVARAAWGEGVFIYLVPAASYPAQTGVAKETFGENAMVPYMAYLAIKRADNQVCVFSPGVDSILADDWSVL